MVKLANKMACKSCEENWQADFEKAPELRGTAKIHALLAAREAEQGRAYRVANATLHYAGDLTKTGLKGELRAILTRVVFFSFLFFWTV